MIVLSDKKLVTLDGGTRTCDLIAGFGLGVALWATPATGGALVVGLAIGAIGCQFGWW